jgi:hypothetical protein
VDADELLGGVLEDNPLGLVTAPCIALGKAHLDRIATVGEHLAGLPGSLAGLG